MADYSIDAMYEIRRHLWDELVSNDIRSIRLLP